MGAWAACASDKFDVPSLQAAGWAVEHQTRPRAPSPSTDDGTTSTLRLRLGGDWWLQPDALPARSLAVPGALFQIPIRGRFIRLDSRGAMPFPEPRKS